MPSEQQYMEEIIKNIQKLYKEYEIRINGENGKKILIIIRFLGIKCFHNNYFQYNEYLK